MNMGDGVSTADKIAAIRARLDEHARDLEALGPRDVIQRAYDHAVARIEALEEDAKKSPGDAKVLADLAQASKHFQIALRALERLRDIDDEVALVTRAIAPIDIGDEEIVLVLVVDEVRAHAGVLKGFRQSAEHELLLRDTASGIVNRLLRRIPGRRAELEAPAAFDLLVDALQESLATKGNGSNSRAMLALLKHLRLSKSSKSALDQALKRARRKLR